MAERAGSPNLGAGNAEMSPGQPSRGQAGAKDLSPELRLPSVPECFTSRHNRHSWGWLLTKGEDWRGRRLGQGCPKPPAGQTGTLSNAWMGWIGDTSPRVLTRGLWGMPQSDSSPSIYSQ